MAPSARTRPSLSQYLPYASSPMVMLPRRTLLAPPSSCSPPPPWPPRYNRPHTSWARWTTTSRPRVELARSAGAAAVRFNDANANLLAAASGLVFVPSVSNELIPSLAASLLPFRRSPGMHSGQRRGFPTVIEHGRLPCRWMEILHRTLFRIFAKYPRIGSRLVVAIRSEEYFAKYSIISFKITSRLDCNYLIAIRYLSDSPLHIYI
ncbi:hypothetical protein C2845_PM01G28040 [Panicum miliaceum]|uniref:Uncharacterized protein n=1 Tax=Panicum miliaceum TaxID=4540 RepID=A0A3L6TXA3_PANMI|nr:hypothetical protein C2845_PM01G28040 [Panicum miliaceum]